MKTINKFKTSLDDDAYQNEILLHVSRTFALTIPQLPKQLKKVVSNAYLLCRIADTIEDDSSMSTEQKHLYINRFIDVVKDSYSPEDFSNSLFLLLSKKATKSEYDLIANVPAVIRITKSFNKRQQNAIQKCVKNMAEGMALYQDSESLNGLRDLNDMEKYCYYVAGVVGEMLTELFCDYLPYLDKYRDELMELGVSFGLGLQMTNILKDIWEDHERGVCWLPRDIFNKYGIDIYHKNPKEYDPRFKSALNDLLGVANYHINNALRYTLIIPAKEKGLRRFCLWAIGMATLTLEKIRKNPDFTQGRQVKIKRSSVKATIFLTSFFVKNDKILTLFFRFVTRNLSDGDIREKLLKDCK